MSRSTIVIPVFNQAALTERCLQALALDGSEVIVVDDASTDNTSNLLAGFAGRIKTVVHTVNQGFATSCNHGAAVASGEFLVFLNNDTVPRPGWLEALERYADNHPDVSVIGAKLLYPDHTVQHAGVVICQDQYPRHIYTGFPAEHPAVNKSRPFQIVTAACMLVRRSAFGNVGGFDAAFRNGFEDVDFCLRLNEAGHTIHYCADCVVEHLESVSPGRFKHAGGNVARYRERWFGRVQPDDVKYYVQDGLLQFNYEGSFPIGLSVSPRLAVLETELREPATERLLAEQNRHIAELRRENTRLSLRVAGKVPDSDEVQYDRLRRRLRETVQLNTPSGATVLVVSKGDGVLTELEGRLGWHFPQTAKGVYAGHHPGDSFTAIAQLEALRSKGADYLVFPKTAFWWLDHYKELDRHLHTYYRPVVTDPDTCLIFELRQILKPAAEQANEPAKPIRAAITPAGWQQAGVRPTQPLKIEETHESK